MPKVKIPQPIGVRIEAARTNGISGTSLVGILRSGDVESLKRAVPGEWTWDILIEFAASRREECEEAILRGYSFTFLTIRGLKTYLNYRFGLQEDKDYTNSDIGVERVRLTSEELALLRDTVPIHWDIAIRKEAAADGRISASIVLAHPGSTT